MKVPFSPPRIDEKIAQSVRDALFSGWITTGPRTKLFEKELSAYTGAAATVCVSAATTGLELMLHWFGVGEGDEVIVPAYTYSATGNVVLRSGAKLILVDVGDDFNIDSKAIASAITRHTKVIMPVDVGGYPCDYDAIWKVIGEKSTLFSPNNAVQERLGRIMLLADAAHSLGARYKDRMSGTLADASCFSFHAVKNLTTAEGGAISLNFPDSFDDEEIYRTLSIKSLHGQTKDALAKSQLGGWRYDIIEPGFKCNMTDLQAAIGLVELSRYESETLPRRKAIFEFYHQRLAGFSWAILPPFTNDQCVSSYHVYMLRIAGVSESDRDAIITEIGLRDVAVNVHFQPLPLFTAYKERGFK
ncbi:MAG: DegT/DnrJ/EryC1/StrS aminotransferase family protein, partial [Flavobacteriales bacterium]|nr:DegT/DnrJ/EryC1/StrS aminotransferase family protein [Flavobacteriales bacterium]